MPRGGVLPWILFRIEAEFEADSEMPSLTDLFMPEWGKGGGNCGRFAISKTVINTPFAKSSAASELELVRL